MKDYKFSDTYKALYDYIIGDLLSQVCKRNKNFCVRNENIPFIIGEKFEEFRNKTIKNMSGTRLDRHKLASCTCGAIIAAKPLIGFNGANIRKNANEMLALYAGLSIIKFYMIYSSVYPLNLSHALEIKFITYLEEKFSMQFPDFSQNICDEQNYFNNLVNSLYWTHQECEIAKKECFPYDVWAYSQIFYHLELYNKIYFEKVFDDFKRATL